MDNKTTPNKDASRGSDQASYMVDYESISMTDNMKVLIRKVKALKQKINLSFRQMGGSIEISGEINFHLDNAIKTICEYRNDAIKARNGGSRKQKRYHYARHWQFKVSSEEVDEVYSALNEDKRKTRLSLFQSKTEEDFSTILVETHKPTTFNKLRGMAKITPLRIEDLFNQSSLTLEISSEKLSLGQPANIMDRLLDQLIFETPSKAFFTVDELQQSCTKVFNKIGFNQVKETNVTAFLQSICSILKLDNKLELCNFEFTLDNGYIVDGLISRGKNLFFFENKFKKKASGRKCALERTYESSLLSQFSDALSLFGIFVSFIANKKQIQIEVHPCSINVSEFRKEKKQMHS